MLRDAFYGDLDPAAADEADAAFPGNPTSVVTLDSSHAPFLSQPRAVAEIVVKLG